MFGGSTRGGGIDVELEDTWDYFTLSPAAYERFGIGCPGSVGTPSLDAPLHSLPWIDDTLTMQLSSLPPSGTVFGVFGVSETAWGSVALPNPLGVVGMFGCTQFVSLDFVIPLVNNGGNARWDLEIPNRSHLLGARFFVQGVVGDSSVNPAGLTVTNAGSAQIGLR